MRIRHRARALTPRRLGVLLAATVIAAGTLLAAMPSGAEEATPEESTTTSTTLAAPAPPPETPPPTPEPSFSAASEVEAAAVGVTLSKDTGLDPDGESITVTATGFTFGQGFYVMFCESTGNPTGDAAGRPTGSACDASKQYWTDNPSGGTPVAADGSFSTTISPVAAFGTVDCTTDTCGIFVRRDHNAPTDYTQDVFVPVTFAASGPTVTLSKDTDLDPDGESITVTATGFTFGQGFYVMFCESTGNPTGDAAGRPTGSACDASKQYWTNNPSGGTPVAADGSFSTTISPVAVFGTVDCTTDTCGIFVRRDHNAPTDYTQDVFVPVTFAASGPTVTLSKSTDLDPDGEAITVNATNFTFGQGFYVMFCESIGNPTGDSAGRPTGSACDASKQYWTNNPSGGTPVAADGSFSTTISPVAVFGTVDCTTDTCGIFVRRDHNAPTDYTQDVFVPVTFAAAAPTGPTVTLSKDTDLDPDGEVITVNGSDFEPSIGVYVRVCKEAAGTLGTAGGRPTGTDCDAPIDVWVDDIGADGAFSTTISPVAVFGTVDCTTDTCGIFVRRDHIAPTDYSQDVFTEIAFGDGGSDPDPGGPGETDEPGGTVTGDLVPGGTATATVWGFAPLSSVDAELHSTPQAIGSYQSGANGTATITFTIPIDLVGNHEFVATGIDPEASPLTVRIPFTIATTQVADNFSASGGLAFTGSDTTDLLVLAAAAALTGLVIVGLTRRRRPSLG